MEVISETLNIRAAKALGLKPKHDGGTWWYIKHLGEYVHESSFGFATSYDWAMLGVKKMIEIHDQSEDWDCYDEFLEVMCKSYGGAYGPAQAILEATPEQITQAWVSVLEGENNGV